MHEIYDIPTTYLEYLDELDAGQSWWIPTKRVEGNRD